MKPVLRVVWHRMLQWEEACLASGLALRVAVEKSLCCAYLGFVRRRARNEGGGREVCERARRRAI